MYKQVTISESKEFLKKKYIAMEQTNTIFTGFSAMANLRKTDDVNYSRPLFSFNYIYSGNEITFSNITACEPITDSHEYAMLLFIVLDKMWKITQGYYVENLRVSSKDFRAVDCFYEAEFKDLKILKTKDNALMYSAKKHQRRLNQYENC